jgi:MYXO-CTERM domain-containing protein
VAIDRVELSVDGHVVATDDGPRGFANTTWDTTTHANGPALIAVHVVDTVGAICDASMSVTVANSMEAGMLDASVAPDAGQPIKDAAASSPPMKALDAGTTGGQPSTMDASNGSATYTDASSPLVRHDAAREDAAPEDVREIHVRGAGCGCRISSAPNGRAGAAFVLGALMLAARRRRTRARD